MLVITLNPDCIPPFFDLELYSAAGLGAERETPHRDLPTLFTGALFRMGAACHSYISCELFVSRQETAHFDHQLSPNML